MFSAQTSSFASKSTFSQGQRLAPSQNQVATQGYFRPPASVPVASAQIPKGCFEEVVKPTAQSLLSGRAKTRPPITFCPLVPGNGGALGVPLSNCIHMVGLRDGEDLVFCELVNRCSTEITLLITWPGYPKLNHRVQVPLTNSGKMITRSILARLIASEYYNFVNFCKSPHDSGVSLYEELGFGAYIGRDPRWMVGGGGYTFEKMRLSGLYHLGGDEWHAEIRVLKDMCRLKANSL